MYLGLCGIWVVVGSDLYVRVLETDGEGTIKVRGEEGVGERDVERVHGKVCLR